MRDNYGVEVIEELERLDMENKQFTSKELKDLIKHYSDKLKLL